MAAIYAALDRGAKVIELNLKTLGSWGYLRRNDAMLLGPKDAVGCLVAHPADRLVAFTDGRSTGGTAYTIRKARALGIKVEIVSVKARAKARSL